MAARMARILVVDDTPQNVKLLADLLGVKGYAVTTATNGEEALAKVATEPPDLVLLDVMMPGMSGYDVCRRIRSDPATALLPVVLCTSLDPQQERINGIAAGADDFLGKPINQPELFARVQSLLRIKRLHDETQRQAAQLAEWSATLERRVAEQVQENERLSRLKRFFSPKLAEMIVDGSGEDPLKSRRREIVVVYCDLRGFTAFAETTEPEELMRTLGSFHAAMGELVLEHDATLERFTGDGMMVFLGDPVPVENAAERGRRCSRSPCARRPSSSPASGRSAASTSVSASASRRASPRSARSASKAASTTARSAPSPTWRRGCASMRRRARSSCRSACIAEVSDAFATEDLGELTLHGFARPMHAFRLLGRAS